MKVSCPKCGKKFKRMGRHSLVCNGSNGAIEGATTAPQVSLSPVERFNMALTELDTARQGLIDHQKNLNSSLKDVEKLLGKQ